MAGRARHHGGVIEQLTFADAAAFDAWLAANHARPEGIWIRMAKKGSGVPSDGIFQMVDAEPRA